MSDVHKLRCLEAVNRKLYAYGANFVVVRPYDVNVYKSNGQVRTVQEHEIIAMFKHEQDAKDFIEMKEHHYD